MSAVRTVGRLAGKFGLSRSTLLYYDRIGLLRPGRRSPAGYRRYSEQDERRLEEICRYRRMGMPLREIGRLLDLPEQGVSGALQRRARQLEAEIALLREQLRVVLDLLKTDSPVPPGRPMDRAAWTSLMRSAGLDEAGMIRWHVEFERRYPDGHQAFLEEIGIPAGEIAEIRRRIRQKIYNLPVST